jgi:hypothetical protein
MNEKLFFWPRRDRFHGCQRRNSAVTPKVFFVAVTAYVEVMALIKECLSVKLLKS